MGFLGAMGKILWGKPVFEPGDGNGSGGKDTGGGSAPGQKSIPTLRFGRVQCDVSGNNLDVWADLRNDSREGVFLDKVLLAGQTWEVDTPLGPGESRQFKIYDGPLMQQPPRGYVQVQFRKQSDGDYFESQHEIRYQQGQSGYTISELRSSGYTKDI